MPKPSRLTTRQLRRTQATLRPTACLEIAVVTKTAWGNVPAGTRINPLRIERMFSSSDFMAYGGQFYKPLADLTVFDAYLDCTNGSDRERVVALMNDPL